MSSGQRRLRLCGEGGGIEHAQEGTNTMKFMLFMSAPYGTGDWDITKKWAPADFQAHMRFMRELNEDLLAAGELVGGAALTPPRQARLVRAGSQGKPEVTDGPFAESKEFLAGYWIVDVETAERAYAIAARASTAPGPGGAPLNMTLEVREVMSDLA
ncbi:MAG: YciI family protein [Myxococcales bacterium]